MRAINWLLDLLYPPRCPFCRSLLNSSEERLCPRCRKRFEALPVGGYRRELEGIRLTVAPFAYEGAVRESLHRYKFGGVTAYVRTYAVIIGKCIDENEISCDIITWVPLSRRRLRKRGYDQARLLAEELSEILHLPAEKLLEKRVDTKPQSGTGSAEKRRANAAGVYACPDADKVRGKHILLVDDIVTTGATLCECAKVLRSAGAAEICGAAVASRN